MAKKKRKGVKPSHSRTGNFFNMFLLIALGLFMVVPLVLSISNSLKPLEELFVFPPRLFVRNPTLKNFHDVFVLMSESWVPFSRYIFNTVLITVAGTLGHLIIASLCAYAWAEQKFPVWRRTLWQSINFRGAI